MSFTCAFRSVGRYLQHTPYPAGVQVQSQQEKKSDRAVVITGGTAEMAPDIILNSLKRGDHVIACVRDKKRFEQHIEKHDRLEVVEMKTKEFVNKDSWSDLLKKVEKTHSKIGVINTIGAAVPPKGMSLEDINIRPAVAVADALNGVIKANPHLKGSFVNISSIAPSILNDSHPYGEIRGKIDRQLTTEYDFVATAIRPGLIFTPLRDGYIVDHGHRFGPEDIGGLFLHPVLGSGEQPMQPVFSLDIQKAVINALDREESAIVNAVGPETMTQAELFEFHAKLAGKKFRKVYVGCDFAKIIADHAPMGRIAPYSVAVFQHLDKDPQAGVFPVTPFEELVGDELTQMKSVYIPTDRPLVLAKAPIFKMTKAIGEKLLFCAHFRKDLATALKDSFAI